MSKALTGLILLPAATLAGCTLSVTRSDGEVLALRSDAFAEYVETVFRQQNEVLDTLAFALDATPDDRELLGAEEAVLDACAGLNDIAVRRQRGERIRPLRDARIARGVPDCEAAAEAAGVLLPEQTD